MNRIDRSRPSRRSALSRRGLVAVALAAALLGACSETPEQMLSSAKSYLDKRDLGAAGIQLKNALQHDGNLAEARFLLGKVHLAQGDLQGAIKELTRARELGYGADEVQPLLARALVRAREYDRLLSEFADVRVADGAGQAAILAALGDARLATGKAAEATTLYEQALAAHAGDADAGIGLARAQLVSGNTAAAETTIRAVLAHAPDSGDAHATLSDVLQVRGAADEALAELEEAVRLRPDAINYHYALVSQLLQRNREADATTRFEALRKLAPNHPSTRYLQAFLDFRGNRLNEARDGLQEVLKQAPDFLPAQLLAGVVMLRLNDQAGARSHLNAVLSRVPTQPLARAMLASSHLATGEPARALELLQPLLAGTVNDPQLLGLAGQVYLANGDYDTAERFLQQAAGAQPQDAGARLRLGAARIASGDAESGLADFAAASQLDGSTIEADLALISAHMRRGEIDQALQAQATLERKQPDNPLVHNVHGGILLAKGDLAAARSAFERALKLNPEYFAAVQNLARLDLSANEPQAALARMRSFADSHPKNVDAQLTYAEVQRLTGAAPAEVLATLDRGSANSPGNVNLALATVQHHLGQREFPQALAAARRIEAANPNDPRVVEALARAQLASGDRQQAIASLNRVATLLPQSIAPLLMVADVHRAGKDNSSAEQALRKALTLQPDAAEVLQRMAGLQLERGDRAAALASAKRLQQQQTLPAGHVLEGEIEALGGNWPAAAKAYREALARNAGGDIAARLHAALLRGQRGAEANALAADWLEKHPKDLPLRGYLAERALAEQRYPEAMNLLSTMNTIAPDNPMVLNNLAWTADQLKDPRALEYAQRAHQLAPDNAAIIDTLGGIQVGRGEIDAGLANLRRAVALAPELVQLQFNLAKNLARAGKKDEARSELDGVLSKLDDKSPLHAEAAKLRAEL